MSRNIGRPLNDVWTRHNHFAMTNLILQLPRTFYRLPVGHTQKTFRSKLNIRIGCYFNICGPCLVRLTRFTFVLIN